MTASRKSYFVPENPQADAASRRGEDVTDRCRNCGHDFMEHTNGVCPSDSHDPNRRW
jgi:hypothetical protein